MFASMLVITRCHAADHLMRRANWPQVSLWVVGPTAPSSQCVQMCFLCVFFLFFRRTQVLKATFLFRGYWIRTPKALPASSVNHERGMAALSLHAREDRKGLFSCPEAAYIQ